MTKRIRRPLGSVPVRRRRLAAVLAVAALGVAVAGGVAAARGVDLPGAAAAPADGGKVALAPAAAPPAEERWSVHGDFLEVGQGQPGYHNRFNSPNTLHSQDNFRQTTQADLFLNLRLWSGAQLSFNGEAFQGFGLGRTHGVADFPSSFAYKVGKYRGDVFIPHFNLRQVIGLGGEREELAAGPQQLATTVDVSRLTFVVGKGGVGDQFDANRYAHDPTTQFINWTLVDAGAFDYAADSLGYEYLATAELNQKRWAARLGYFTVPRVNNGLATDGHLLRAFQIVGELEGRWQLRLAGGAPRPGIVRLTGWIEQQHLGQFSHLLADQARFTPGQREPYRLTYGAVLGGEQELAEGVGAWARLSWRNPRVEAYQFTDVDRALTVGLSLAGARWGRAEDSVGLAYGLSGIGVAHRDYFKAGGLGVLVGDGRLPHYGPEHFVETYYSAHLYRGVELTVDYQLFGNPSYNRDKGLLHVFTGRLFLHF